MTSEGEKEGQWSRTPRFENGKKEKEKKPQNLHPSHWGHALPVIAPIFWLRVESVRFGGHVKQSRRSLAPSWKPSQEAASYASSPLPLPFLHM